MPRCADQVRELFGRPRDNRDPLSMADARAAPRSVRRASWSVLEMARSQLAKPKRFGRS